MTPKETNEFLRQEVGPGWRLASIEADDVRLELRATGTVKDEWRVHITWENPNPPEPKKEPHDEVRFRYWKDDDPDACDMDVYATGDTPRQALNRAIDRARQLQ